jgi:hypothetical protein
MRAIWFMGAKNLFLKIGRRVVKDSRHYDRFPPQISIEKPIKIEA